jgi:gamma-glutamyltranspeptidase/glutathione hydrolase
VLEHGKPGGGRQEFFGKHTTHFSTADAEGNWVACTATINTSFGSKVVVPGTGVVLNNQMDDFSIQPGVTNYFGLVGAEANAVAPGKRPLSSMSPTIVLKDDKPILSVGAAGGPTIISQTLLAIIYVIDFGMPIDIALAQPRFHQQWKPDELKIERAVGEEVIRQLRERGHEVVPVDLLGVAQAVGFDGVRNGFAGAADPRGEGMAQGW